jgi:hypothetical protein
MFRFTIRDVLWLTVVVAVLTAWWTDHRGMSNHNSELHSKLSAAKTRLDWLGQRFEEDERALRFYP